MATLAITMYREVFHMTKKAKKIEDKELEKVQFAEEPTELLKELIKVNQEIKDILSRLKDRFV